MRVGNWPVGTVTRHGSNSTFKCWVCGGELFALLDANGSIDCVNCANPYLVMSDAIFKRTGDTVTQLPTMEEGRAMQNKQVKEETVMLDWVSEKTFAEAITALEEGKTLGIQRDGWNGKGLFVKMQRPDANSKMTYPYAYIEYPPKNGVQDRCPWVPSQSDLFAKDWQWQNTVS